MKCQSCNSVSNIDLNIPDKLWLKIMLANHQWAGLLCPVCTMKRIVEAMPDGGAFELVDLCTPWKKVKGTIRFHLRVILSTFRGLFRKIPREWERIDTTELLSSIKAGDRVKYCLHIDKKPYKKRKVKQVFERYSDMLSRKVTTIDFNGDDFLLLNCITGYDLPHDENSNRSANYQLFLYRLTNGFRII